MLDKPLKDLLQTLTLGDVIVFVVAVFVVFLAIELVKLAFWLVVYAGLSLGVWWEARKERRGHEVRRANRNADEPANRRPNPPPKPPPLKPVTIRNGRVLE